ncbi:MAG: HlyC/CorC family transporter [Candidatus Verstraetearchaeota archaeon]|nr:HlyC/CorC family transporter [Candidatus Verstraetearchaeota archaeon]
MAGARKECAALRAEGTAKVELAKILLEIAVLAGLIVSSALFSATEIAVFSANRIRIRQLREECVKEAEILCNLLKEPEKVLSTILVGNNLVNVAASALATAMAIELVGNVGLGIATGIMTFLILVFGEVTPKAYAVKNAEKLALKAAKPLYLLTRVLSPVVWAFTMVANVVINKLMKEQPQRRSLITEEEIKAVLRIGEEEGVIEKDERKMMVNVMKFMDLVVRSVMIPREQVVMLSAQDTVEDLLEVFHRYGHSRYPVYDGSPDNVIGMIHVKDLLKNQETLKNTRLGELIRPIIIVDENTKLSELLRMMQRKKIHMAAVVDRDGKFVGVAALEDLLEEIVGEISDEYD